MENSDVVGNFAAAVDPAPMTKRMDADARRGPLPKITKAKAARHLDQLLATVDD
jgi:hypothetical protein